nr:MAG TPA: hypothetical protein [Caudoviricetes sp.]
MCNANRFTIANKLTYRTWLTKVHYLITLTL